MSDINSNLDKSAKQVFLVFGGNGDLAMRKLLPALYYLEKENLLDHVDRIVGLSKTFISDKDYCEKVLENFDRFLDKNEFEEQVWQRFKIKLGYISIDLSMDTAFESLVEKKAIFKHHSVLSYLALDPIYFGSACQALHLANLIDDQARVVLEKPIGTDLQSSIKVNETVAHYFSESQVFRIDHYLGKETVQNLLALRFGNFILEPLWKNSGIDNVQITASETVGVGNRWNFYHNAGAMRDMVQNHLLQLLCLVAMEVPLNFDPKDVRDEKLKVLKSLRKITANDVYEHTVRGQYEGGSVNGEMVSGYEEEGTHPSQTETFVAIRAHIDNWRWRGVPFYLRTGKRLAKRYSEIVIQFKSVPHSIFYQENEPQDLQPNKLVIRLQPDDGIELTLMNKVPSLNGGPMVLGQQSLKLDFSSVEKSRPIDAYERLLLDFINDNQTLFVRRDEVEAAWNWVDPIINAWKQSSVPAKKYTAGSFGPASSLALPLKDGFEWHE